jgi:pimeloyl-ACP methyl ester carboxylesterase
MHGSLQWEQGLRAHNRRSVLLGALASLVAPRLAWSGQRQWLTPDHITRFTLPELQSVTLSGAEKVTFVRDGPANAPLILYFHGWGDDYHMVMPLESGLAEAGFRIVLPHRPGYVVTALFGTRGNESVSWEGPVNTADLTAQLLDQLYGTDKWNVAVVSMSGGTPAALAFASRCPAQTRALVLQAGVTHAFSDAKYVPEALRGEYTTAFNSFGWTGDQVSQIIFALLVKLRDSFMTDEEVANALTGTRFSDAKQDLAFGAVFERVLRDDPSNRDGEWSDVRQAFFSTSPYCNWENIRAPTLILHDDKDPFVPFLHAQEAKAHLPHAILRTFSLAGHIIWLGREAYPMHETRLAFLKRHS